MSLILDALKKLERDKENGEPGVLVVGAIPWHGVRRSRTPTLALALVMLLVLVGIVLGAWWLGRTHQAAPSAADAPGRATAPGTAAPSAPLATRATPSAPPARRLTLPARTTDAARAGAGPREVAPPPRSGPQLNAISQQDGKPVAVIDGRLVREGDSVDGVRVLRIGETEVEVEVRGVRSTLRF